MKTLLTTLCLMLVVYAKSQTTNYIDPNGVAKVASPEFVEIGKVIIKMRECMTNSTSTLKNGKQVFTDKKFSALIQKIDTSECPKDFRIAWEDFTFAVNKRVQMKGAIAPLLEILYPPTSAKGLSDAGGHQEKVNDADEKITETAHELKKVIIKYSPD